MGDHHTLSKPIKIKRSIKDESNLRRAEGLLPEGTVVTVINGGGGGGGCCEEVGEEEDGDHEFSTDSKGNDGQQPTHHHKNKTKNNLNSSAKEHKDKGEEVDETHNPNSNVI